jgi:predicted ABC-type transport system involved in lysophospholipase L1 biosynthesis ATPase subunit
MTLLELSHISKHRMEGGQSVAMLDDVSLQIDEGDRIGIWGIRRSGKSTLLRVASGVEPSDAGSIFFDGHDLGRMSQRQRAKLLQRRGIGLACAPWRPSRNKPVIDHVALPLLSGGMSLREARTVAMGALGRVGVADCAYSSTDQLAQDELVRVRLAQQLVCEPRLLLVDEPAVLSGPKASAELFKLLWSLTEDHNLALVVASEDLDSIQAASRRMRIMRGRLRTMERPGTVVPFPERLATG